MSDKKENLLVVVLNEDGSAYQVFRTGQGAPVECTDEFSVGVGPSATNGRLTFVVQHREQKVEV